MNDTQSSNTPPSRFKKVKRVLWISSCALFFLIVVSSLSEQPKEQAQTNSTSSAGDMSSSEQVYKINEEVNSSDVVWKVTSARDRGDTLKSNESKYPSIQKSKTTTGRFVEVIYTLENLQKDSTYVLVPQLVDNTGREFSQSTDTFAWVPEGENLSMFSSLQPNLKKEFTTIYEVPVDASGLQLKVGTIRSRLIDLAL